MRIRIRQLILTTLCFATLAAVHPSGRTGAADDATPPVATPIDLGGFTTVIDNSYFPLTPGTTWVYEGTTDGELERNEVIVTHETRDVMGVTCVVVRDVVSKDGEVVEDTLDWYAQDADGNVWYFGEDSKDYEDGELVSTEGSWEAGVDGAQPGIIMLANPAVGDSYWQEYYPGEAEDRAEVIARGETVTVPYGTFEDVLVTMDLNPLEPGIVEHKSYAPGIGLVLEEKVEGEEGRNELIEIRTAAATPEA